MELTERSGTDLACEHYTGIDQVEANEWDTIVSRATGLKHSVLETFEYSDVNNLVCHYLMFREDNQAVGRANLYEVSMDFKSMDQELSESAVESINSWHPAFLNFSMAECGLFAMNGDGLVVKQERHLTSAIQATSKKLHQIADKKGLDLLVFRDVPVELYSHYEKVLVSEGYAPTAGFTNAVLDIQWNSLNDYLESLRSKDRNKIKAAFKKQNDLGIRLEVTSDYTHLAPKLAQLWANVNASSSDYNREQLDEAFFRESGYRLAGDSEVILFYYDDALVAFMWNLIGEEDYHMADWGVDYDYPHYREANFYRAASVYSLERAIALKKQRMQLGMTNYVPKQFLGAKMQPLIYFIKHHRKPEYSGTVARMMTDAIQQPENLNYFSERPGFPCPISDGDYKAAINSRAREYAMDDILSVTEDSYDIDLLKVGGMYSFYPDNHCEQIDMSTPCFIDYTRFSEVAEQGAAVLQRGSGYCPGPAFVSGQPGPALILQDLLADLFGKDSSQLFANASSMYASVFGSILSDQSTVFVDEQVSPLLISAVAATGKPMSVFRHRDYAHLEELLGDHKHTKNLIVTESLFTLFSDAAPLKQIVQIKERTGARLFVDESMAFGFFGKRGSGFSEQQGLVEHVDILGASLYAGFGLPGAFVAGPKKFIEHMRHQSPELLLSPGVTNVDCAMMIESLRLLQKGTVDRSPITERSQRLAEALVAADYTVIRGEMPVISVVIGDYIMALAMQKKFFNQNIVVSSVGPPLVPEEMSSLQLRINHSVDESMTKRVISAFELMSSDIYGK
ncbi:8-amino-7-oxononanoate synthase family protein [Marinimicrobium agarilyticum]|uniref:8-amino-7-oxononanoate synthase family protein n=1 Tax=Marinimicrobium agarilyticum TaxID=306546 RepID=UPI00041583DB|nr:aminotransferase class I/II-fold pyridoxal phosphate-dependent enzyme [Marinimicrobium agarilyticum]